MITVCTVTLDLAMPYFQTYVESLTTRAKLVSEVQIAKVDEPPSFEKVWSEGEIKFHMFGCMGEIRLGQGQEHGLGLHECISRASNDTLLFHDPDVFFYRPADQFFFELKQKYGLHAVGISHCAATKMAYSFFPYIGCLMVNKSDLPGEEFLNGLIEDDDFRKPYPGKYLIRMWPVLRESFPNPPGDYDTGSYLCLWARQQGWRWLSFQTADVHTYSPKYHRGNVKISEKLGNERLLYHATSGTVQGREPVILENYKKAWLESLGGCDD